MIDCSENLIGLISLTGDTYDLVYFTIRSTPPSSDLLATILVTILNWFDVETRGSIKKRRLTGACATPSTLVAGVSP